MKIIGTGSALPKLHVSNDDLAKIMDTSDEWIRSRTGIGKRHIATEETTTSLSVEAALKALEASNTAPEELDMIIAATISSDKIIPTLSCEVQAAIHADNAVAFDIGAACSGFIFALATADAYMKAIGLKKILVIGAEVLSKLMDWNDRGTCVLFGDGAGACVVSNESDNLLSMVQGSKGADGDALVCLNRPVNNPFIKKNSTISTLDYVHMDGQAVYKFAVKTVPKAINEALEKANLTADDVNYFILHQANIRIIQSVAKKISQPMDKFPNNLTDCGNISAGSVPILLDKVWKDGIIKQGDKIALSGFGAGLTWGACILTV